MLGLLVWDSRVTFPIEFGNVEPVNTEATHWAGKGRGVEKLGIGLLGLELDSKLVYLLPCCILPLSRL